MKTEQGDFPEVLIEGEQSPRGFPGRNEDRPRGFPGSVVSWECQRVAAESVTRHRERNTMKGEAKKLAETLYAWNQELLRRSSMEWESVSTTAVHQMWQDGSLDAR